MRKFLTVLAMSLAIVSTPAKAQMATLDFANLIQAIFSFVSESSQEAGQAKQIAVQGQQYYTQAQQLLVQERQIEYDLRQLQSLNVNSVGGIFNTLGTGATAKQTYEQRSNNLYGTLGKAEDVLSKKYNEMSASGLSQDEWLKREAEINRANQDGNGFLTTYESDVLKSVGKRYDEVKEIQPLINQTEGTHSAMQLMNAQMNGLLGGVNQILEHDAFMAQRQLTRESQSDAVAARVVKSRSSLEEDRAETSRQSKQQWERMQKFKPVSSVSAEPAATY